MARVRAAWGRRKWLAVVAFLIPAAAGITVIHNLPSIYRATAVVLVERQQVPEAFVRPTVTSELDTRLNTIGQEILSRARLERLVGEMGLYPQLRGKATPEAITNRMRSDITLEVRAGEGRSRATTSFALSYRGRDPVTVAAVANMLASSYIEENSKVRERQASGTADFLKSQLRDARRRLDENERRTSAFRTQYQGELPQQMPSNLAQLDSLNNQLRLNADQQVRAAQRRDSVKQQIAEANALGPVGAPVQLGAPAPAFESPAGRIGRLRQELATARSRYRDGHPSIVRLQEEISALQDQLKAAAATEDKPPAAAVPVSTTPAHLRDALENADAEVRILKGEEARLKHSIAVMQRRVDNTPRREQEFQDLARDYDSIRELYQTLLKRHEDAQLAENMEQRQKGEHFRILDAALPSPEPVAPKRAMLVVACLAVSGLLGLGVLILADLLDTSFHSLQDLRAFTAVPVLASISTIPTEHDHRLARRRAQLATVGAAAILVLVVYLSHVLTSGSETLATLLTKGA